MPSIKYDKTQAEAHAAASEKLVIVTDGSFYEPEEGDRLEVEGNATARMKVVGAGEKFLIAKSDDRRMALFTEDGFEGIGEDGSYVHVKSGKRFVTYKVEDVGRRELVLRKVAASEVRTGLCYAEKDALRRSLSVEMNAHAAKVSNLLTL